MKLLHTTNIWKLWSVNSYVNYLKSISGNCILHVNASKGIRCSNTCNFSSIKKLSQNKDIAKRHYKNSPSLTWDTHIVKDVTLFINDNTSFYKFLNLFSFSQFVFWTYLGYVAITTMKDDPVPEKELVEVRESWAKNEPKFVPLLRQLNVGKYKNGIGIFCEVAGVLVLFLSVFFTRRSVKSIVLRKGGDMITLELFSVFHKGKLKTTPLSNLSAQNSRQNAKSYVSLKLKGHNFYYILDITKGKFPDEELFDRTVGLKRVFY